MPWSKSPAVIPAARFIATKLCHRFVSHDPPATLVDRLAQSLLRTGRHQGTAADPVRIGRVPRGQGHAAETALPFYCQLPEALGANTFAGKGALEPLNQMGQGLFQYPAGRVSDEEAPWLGTLMWRWNYALALTANEAPDVRVDLWPIMRALGGNQIPIARGFGYFTGPAAPRWKSIVPYRTRPRSRPPRARKQGKGAKRGLLCGVILASPAFKRCLSPPTRFSKPLNPSRRHFLARLAAAAAFPGMARR
ncbi:MAG: DUF1800 family protein [Verrucomicrobiales bacterium]